MIISGRGRDSNGGVLQKENSRGTEEQREYPIDPVKSTSEEVSRSRPEKLNIKQMSKSSRGRDSNGGVVQKENSRGSEE